MAKSKKRQHHNDASAPVVIDGNKFPAEITVELWHKPAKGKRALVGSRRYAIAADLPDSAAVTDTSADKKPPAVTGTAADKKPRAVTGDAAANAKVARPAPARKRPAPARKRPAPAMKPPRPPRPPKASPS